MQLAAKLGIDQHELARIMEASSGRSLATKDYTAYKGIFGANSHSPQATKAILEICLKDHELAVTVARDVGVSTPILEGIISAQRTLGYPDMFRKWREQTLCAMPKVQVSRLERPSKEPSDR